jgi:hypothetical protein
LIAANDTITCDQTLPTALLGAGGGVPCTPVFQPTWELCVALPEPQLVPSTIDLTTHPFQKAFEDVNCTGWSVGTDACNTVVGPEGLGQLSPATLTIESVDPSSVTFTIDDKTLAVGNGDYTAQRCP